MRGTLKGIEVKCWGGEQTHRWVGSLKPLQDLHTSEKELSGPASALVFYPLRLQGEAHRLGNYLNLASEGLSTLMQRAEEVRGLRSRRICSWLTVQPFCTDPDVHRPSASDVDAHRVHGRILAPLRNSLLEQARGFEHIGAWLLILEHEAQSLSRSVLV